MAQCCQSGSILDDGTGDNRRADGSRPTGGVVGGVVPKFQDLYHLKWISKHLFKYWKFSLALLWISFSKVFNLDFYKI